MDVLSQLLKGSQDRLGFVPNPEESYCFNHGVGDMHCTVIINRFW